MIAVDGHVAASAGNATSTLTFVDVAPVDRQRSEARCLVVAEVE